MAAILILHKNQNRIAKFEKTKMFYLVYDVFSFLDIYLVKNKTPLVTGTVMERLRAPMTTPNKKHKLM